jgi:ABC-type Fe3+-hydroxamate transport system substrate-binding protein
MSNKKNRVTFFSCLLLLLCILTPIHVIAFPLRVKDDLNRSIEIPHAPQRIISLAPSVTEILFAIGVGERVVGISDYCNYPPEVTRVERVGGFADPDLEKIVTLKPDLVVAFGPIQIPVVHELEERGVRVFWTYPRTMEEILSSFERMGELTGAPAAGKQLREAVEKQIKGVQERLKGLRERERPGIFRVMGLDPLSTIGGLNFQSEIYRAAGGRNIFEDVEEDFFIVDVEEFRRRNPDVIVVCGDDPKKLRQYLKDQKDWKDIEAIKEDRILVLSCDLICRPGPRVGQTIEKVASLLHPEKFSSSSQRIVSLVPALTEELYLLGVGDRVVGVTTYCQRPREAQQKERVGTVVDVNIERIIDLRPDLVIASPLMDHKQLQKLRDVGVRVEVFQPPQDFKTLCDGFLTLARFVGGEEEAREIITRAERELDIIKEKVKGLSRPRVFTQIGAKPLFTAGGDSFIDDFIVFAGGINIACDDKTSVYSREEVIRRNPDIILIVTMGITGEKEKATWLRYNTVNAVKNRRIYAVESYRFCSPTPVSFVETVQELMRLFHGVT